MGSLPLVPAVETRLFYQPGQPPGVYGALFRVASPPPPPVLQTQTPKAPLLKQVSNNGLHVGKECADTLFSYDNAIFISSCIVCKFCHIVFASQQI